MPASRQPLTTAKARNAFLINQLATPGLGSLMAGRRLSGTGQLVLAIAGFVLVLLWFIAVMRQFYGQIQGNVEVKPVGWIGFTGMAVFVVAWLWALTTSLGLLREARKNQVLLFEQPQPPPLP